MTKKEFKAVVTEAAESLQDEVERDIEASAEYQKAFRNGVQAMEALMLAAVDEVL